MRPALPFVALWLAAALSACGSSPSPDASVDAATRDAAPFDAGPFEGDAGALPLPPSAVPLEEADVRRIGPGDDIDVTSALTIDADGSVVLVFDSFDDTYMRSTLWRAVLPRGERIVLPRPEGRTTQLLEANPSFVDDALYFSGAEGFTGAAPLYRADDDGLSTSLGELDDAPSLLSWPRLGRVDADTVGVAFLDGAGLPRFATGPSPEAFGEARVVDDEAAALADFGVFGDGTIAVSFQRPVGSEPMVSFVRLSRDGGASFEAAFRVTDSSPNVHDTALVARTDGDLDLYYIYPASASGFALFRRALSREGALGQEQRVTAEGLVGEPSKPAAIHTGEGVFLAYADIAERAANLEPSRQEMVIAHLETEAPPAP